MKLDVLSAADGAAWEGRLLTAFEAGRHPIAIVRRCVDVVDLLAIAGSGQGRAALVAAGLRRLDSSTVDMLAAAGVIAVGVAARADPLAEQRLHQAGITHIVWDDADPAVVAAILLEAVRVEAVPPAMGARHASRATGDVPTDGPVSVRSASRSSGTGGTVLAVWGPTGAPGRTTVAVNLADEVSGLGASVLLIDADVYGGTIAPVLGVLDESPGIAAACRQAAAGRLDADALSALCWQLKPRLRVLTGIPLASRWPELRPPAVGSVLAAARSLADVTVVDCGFCLETDEELSFDTTAPRRNGATLAVLAAADLVIAVGAADPVGMQRLIRGLDELRDADLGTAAEVVLNRVRNGVVPGRPADEVSAALQRFAHRTPAALLPADAAALDSALAEGRLLSEARPGSPLRQAIRELAGALVGVPISGRRPRQRHRRAG